MEFKKLLGKESKNKYYIKKSAEFFKIRKYYKKCIDSIEIANHLAKTSFPAKNHWVITISYYSMLYISKALILTKGYETDDHYATQIALEHLFMPKLLEEKDIEILRETQQMLEEEYIEYFEDARKESNTSRYSATKTYKERRASEVNKNANKFISKLIKLLEKTPY